MINADEHLLTIQQQNIDFFLTFKCAKLVKSCANYACEFCASKKISVSYASVECRRKKERIGKAKRKMKVAELG